jgi:predicted HD superfamily hydrolase involved in NAD metabolism
MNREDIIISVSSGMPERRWIHTLGVMSTARQLAQQYGEDPDRAELAAIIHDVAKFWPVEQQRNYIIQHELDLELLQYNKELWHAEIGAHLTWAQYGIDDQGIIDAIRYHTSGRADMSKIEKIVWLADYIEPNRNFPGVEEARKLAETSLEESILFGLNATIIVLIEKNRVIYPCTLAARNSLLHHSQSG